MTASGIERTPVITVKRVGVSENSGTAIVTVTRRGGSSGVVGVTIKTSNGNTV